MTRKRRLEPQLAGEHGDICPGRMVVGSRIAVYRPKADRWYAGRVVSVGRGPSGNIHTVAYDDDTTVMEDLSVETWRWETGPPRKHRKAPEHKTAASLPPTLTLEAGQSVEAHFPKKRGWFPGAVQRINEDGTLAIHYADGDQQERVLRKDVRPSKAEAPPPSQGPL